MTSVKNLCKKYTDLTDSEIVIVEQLSNHLTYIADLTKADIFLDVMTRIEGEALVVAEANPATASSLYTQSVVGELALKKNEPAVLKSLKTGNPVWEVKGVSQEGIPVKQSVIPIKASTGNVVSVLIMEQDISEQIQTEAKVELLSETAEKLTSALLDVTTVDEVLPTLLQDAVIITNLDYTVLYANQLAYQLLENSGGLLPGSTLIDSLKEIIDIPVEAEGNSLANELLIDNRFYKFKYVPFKKKNQVAGHIILLRDITELRHKEKELIAKAAVIKEIHHRVKNNLHTVASLLRLQMRRSDSEQVKKVLLNSINRISSIALIHEALAVEDIHYIDLIPLIRKVAHLSIRANVDTECAISVNVSGPSVNLPSEIATGTAMVLNELIQNSVEHGFSDSGTGKIDIHIESSDNLIYITFTDNGCGLPDNFNVPANAGLGLTIVESIIREKLEGDLQFSSNNGTTVRLCFPLQKGEGYLCTA